MKRQAYQIERDRRVLIARPGCAECSGTDITALVDELCARIDADEADSVVVELGNVRHMDSCCISRLLVLRQHTQAAGGSVALARCQDNVAFLFRMTRLDQALGLYDTTELAVAELRDRRTRPKPENPHDRPPQTTHGPISNRSYAPQLMALLRAHRRRHTRPGHAPTEPPTTGTQA